MSTHQADASYPYQVDSGTTDAPLDERSPSYSDIHNIANGGSIPTLAHHEEPVAFQEPSYPSVYRAMSTQNVVVISPRSTGSPQQQLLQNERLQQQYQKQQRSIPSSGAQSPYLDSAPTIYISPSGLHATLELESDTVEIYDRSNDGFQYSLKGSIDLQWTGNMELLLKDTQIDFMGYADTAILRYESEAGSTVTETPVHHTHDFIPTPLVLAQAQSSLPQSTPPSTGSSNNISTQTDDHSPSETHQKSLPIDLTLPEYLPDTTTLAIGKIRYELQVSMEVTWAPGTIMAMTEKFILRRPILVHRIVYPSSHLQPRLAMGLDSGGVEIQVKVPRLLHCENTLLAVELYAKPRTRNVKLYKAKVVFEQIETDRYQRSSAGAAVPRAVVPFAASTKASTTLPAATTIQQQRQQQPATGPPPVPRLVTRRIAQPLEVLFEEPTTELQPHNLHLQLVLSPDLCVDVQSSWLQVSHTLRVEIEYTTDEEAYAHVPPISAPPLSSPPAPLISASGLALENTGATPIKGSKIIEKTMNLNLRDESDDDDEDTAAPGLWEQEGDAIEDDDDDDDAFVNSSSDAENNVDTRPQYILDEKRAVRAVMDHDIGSGSSTTADHRHQLLLIEDIDRPPSPPPLLSPQPPSFTVAAGVGESSSHPQSPGPQQQQPYSSIHSHAAHTFTQLSNGRSLQTPLVTSPPSSSYCLAMEEIPVRVVRVVATALVDASTIAQAAGETEAGLPTYESVIEATGLPAYAEEKLEDDHEEAEASGTVSGVLGGAARRLEGDDAQVERRSS
ncbi:hypothetical protein FBU30_005477 [Linnemannia zychae]|nr:hypothetical protein FBU30_005477 [Linnemannia zychae]